MTDGVTLLTFFVLSVFIGFEVVSKVSSVLHTPLMSGANAIHGVILVGAVIVTGHADGALAVTIGLVAAVCFILALKGLSSPKTARQGNWLGAAGALLACVVVFLAEDLDHIGPILVAIAVGTAPAAPSQLPCRAVAGDDRPLSARMKQTAATR